MKHPARRHGVRIIVHGEQPAENVATGAKRIPEPGRHATKLFTVRGAPENIAAFATTRERRAVSSSEFVIGAKVFPDAEIKIALGIEGQAGQPVMRIVPFSVEKDDPLMTIRFADPLGVN